MDPFGGPPFPPVPRVLPDSPSLASWAQQRLTALFEATSQESFAAAFDGLVAEEVTITVNGKVATRDDYKKLLQGEQALEVAAQVQYIGALEVPSDLNEPLIAGTVGLFYVVTFGEAIVVDVPQTNTTTSSLNLLITQDMTLIPPRIPLSGRPGFIDRRRVSVLNQITVDKEGTVLLPAL